MFVTELNERGLVSIRWSFIVDVIFYTSVSYFCLHVMLECYIMACILSLHPIASNGTRVHYYDVNTTLCITSYEIGFPLFIQRITLT